MIPVISVVAAKSNTGKTTLVEKLLVELTSRGWRIATIKHHHKDFEIDKPGKDSWRHAQAGAQTVILVSPYKMATIRKLEQEPSLDEIVATIKDVDLIITEGYKKGNRPKLEVFRGGVSDSLITSPGELFAVATDVKLEVQVPCFSLEDSRGISDLVEKMFLNGKNQ